MAENDANALLIPGSQKAASGCVHPAAPLGRVREALHRCAATSGCVRECCLGRQAIDVSFVEHETGFAVYKMWNYGCQVYAVMCVLCENFVLCWLLWLHGLVYPHEAFPNSFGTLGLPGRLRGSISGSTVGGLPESLKK